MERLARGEDADRPTDRWAGRLVVAALLASVFVVRAWRADQPILENYVGRQVPTAMVARNLVRGSGFLHPQLDTGPFPNLFLVEPPLMAQLAAWISEVTAFPLDASGRIVSAAGTTLAAWGLFGLIIRRRGRLAAVASVVAFASFPVTIRYGRAFQPDALALGLLVAGLNLWDMPGRGRPSLGMILLALGIAQKAPWGLSIFPPLWLILAGRPARLRGLALASVVPAVVWYTWAGMAVGSGSDGSSASADNAWNWLERLTSPDLHRVGPIVRDFALRSFTPIGVIVALVALAWRAKSDRFWTAWMVGGGLTLLLLFGKLHHDYYWLLLAPAMAGWVGIGIVSLAERSRPVAAVVLASIVAMGFLQTRSTWTTPDEWRDAVDLGSAVRGNVPAEALVIAPEAVIHLGDRRGCRLEWEAGGVRRAGNEWRPSPAFAGTDPADLVAFYRRAAGARYFADLDDAPAGSPRARLHQAFRLDPGVGRIDDRPGRYLLVEFVGHD